jgi:hypothetical protein
MKNFIQAIVIIAVAMAVYKSPLPAWLQGVLSDGTTPVPESSKVSRAFEDDDFAFDDDALASGDETQMLEAFEQGYQPPGDCDSSPSAKTRCDSHRQRRLDEFRRQWSAYYQR